MKRTILLICFCLINIYVFGQKYVQRSPEVSKMISVTNIPVSLNTGIPQISIPIHTFKLGDKEFPISLSYQANGVKLKDRSGICGVKWSLNYGGMVSEMQPYSNRINQKDNSEILKYYGKDFSEEIKSQHSSYLSYSCGSKSFSMTDDIIKNRKSKLFKYLYDNILDVGFPNECDVIGYYYSCFSGSGKVYYRNSNDSESRNYITIPYARDINFTRRDKGFEIIDGDGVNYRYSEEERNYTYNYQGGPDCSLTYFITDVSFNNNNLKYEYENNNLEYEWELSDEYRIIKSDNLFIPSNSINSPLEGKDFIKTSIASKCIKTIKSDNGDIVKFKYKDVENNCGSKQLKDIEIYRFGFLIKKMTFKYMYNGRYNISEISLEGREGNIIGKYQFTYNEGNIPRLTDQSVSSYKFCEDLFGYYNGSSNSSNIPNKYSLSGGDRSYNEKFAKIGLIKSIQYPTGLKKTFTFESHIISEENDEFFRSLDRVVDRYKAIIVKSDENKYLESEFTLDKTKIVRTSKILNTTYLYFEILFPEKRGINNKHNVGNMGGEPNPDPITPDVPDFSISVEGTDKNSTRMYVNERNYKQFLNKEMSFNPDTYKVKIKLKSSNMKIFFRWKEREKFRISHDNIKEIKIPPFRISEIISEDKGRLNKTIYKYKNPVLINFPNYERKHFIVYDTSQKSYDHGKNEITSQEADAFSFIHSKPNRSIDSDGGSYLTYGSVEERKGNGYSIYNFNTFPNYSFSYTVVSPLEDYSGFRSLMTHQTNYNLKDEKVSEVFNEYDLKQEQCIIGIKADKLGSCKYNNAYLQGYTQVGCMYPEDTLFGSFEIYRIPQMSYNLKKSETTYYTKNAKIELINEYKYDSKYHKLIEKKTSTPVSNKINKEEYKYPFNSSSSFSNDMLDKNMINYPIEIIKKHNDKIYEKHKSDYQVDINRNLILKKEYFGGKNSTYENSIRYLSHNDKGQVENYIMKDGTEVILLWGYNNKYPVAEIRNLSYSEFINKYMSLKEIKDLETNIDSNNIKSKLLQVQKSIGTSGFMTIYLFNHFGMTDLIDMNGKVKKYKYDSAGKLSDIIDNDGNTEKSFKYNYRTSKKNK